MPHTDWTNQTIYYCLYSGHINRPNIWESSWGWLGATRTEALRCPWCEVMECVLPSVSEIKLVFVIYHSTHHGNFNRELRVKVIPQQAEVAQGVPGRLRPRIFLTFRYYKGGRSSAKCTGRLYPRRNPWYSLSEAESTSGQMVLSGVPRKKSPVTPPGIDPGTVRLVAQCLNHYAQAP